MIRLFLSGLVLFSTLGVFIAKVLFLRLGLEPHYLYFGIGALVVSLLLVFRGVMLIVIVGLLTVAVNLPDHTLLEYGVDRDVLLTLLLLMVIYPFVHRAVSS